MLGRSYPNSFYKLASHKLLIIINLSQSSINQIRNTYKKCTCTQYVHFTTKIYENCWAISEKLRWWFVPVLFLIVDKLLSSERSITPWKNNWKDITANMHIYTVRPLSLHIKRLQRRCDDINHIQYYSYHA